ncbi:MAG: hypothetical protein J7L73_07165 [Anaerolineales bacterium]|nr:hypothetical protein [Anaerolineales bacterium]
MKVNPETFEKYLQQLLFKEDGDSFERTYGQYTSKNFPNCEIFWREFVVPLTKRMDGYPDCIVRNINLRHNIDIQLEDIANMHYSMFMNLIFTHLHLEKPILSSLENIYAHLGSVCDLAEMVIEKWYFLFLQCQRKETPVLQRLSRDKFLKIAGKWYDDKYPNMYKNYLARGKSPPIHIPSRGDILAEYYGKKSPSRKVFARRSQAIRQMRNVIVHDVRIARIIDLDGNALIPKSDVINKYKSWRKVAAVKGNKEIIRTDFAEQYQQAKEDIDSLESALNNMWKKLIIDFRGEFYSEERSGLRNKFRIEFSADVPIILNGEGSPNDDKTEYISASGEIFE